ncbi:DoxX family protein [Maribacter chungangensis]|uniref:DoxX family protein n=1 Tax=Maribacter chungangensis TaxID=1069117 RepID=A0ABW3B878_9FLAO
MNILTALLFFSSFSFLFFGLGCLYSPHMKTEFIRYGLAKQRTTVGVLQLIGAISLLLGYLYHPVLQLIAALGLCILMILGFGVRLKIKDSFIQSAPSLLYAIINGYIFLTLV